MTNGAFKKYGNLRVYQNGTIVGPSGAPLTTKLDSKLRPYITRSRTKVLVQDLVVRTWHSRGPEHTHVIHKDKDPRNNRAGNLKWATSDEYTTFWLSPSGPPTIACIKKTNLPREFYKFIFKHRSKGARRIQELLSETEWYDHGLTDYMLRRILKGHIRRDLFLEFIKGGSGGSLRSPLI